MPNAFVVNGVTPTFKPVAGYIDYDNYELSIFNRWGQTIWQTNDVNEGWDGSSGGTPLPEAVYIYVFSYLNGGGQRIEKRGTVTLIRGGNN